MVCRRFSEVPQAMQNPMRWALPLFRFWGVQVRVHILFFLVTLGLFIRQVSRDGSVLGPLDVLLFTVVMLFGIILVHEYGHVYGARRVDGDSEEILIWPLGGLAYCDIPHHWKASFITTLAGPMANVFMALLSGFVLLGFGFIPTLSPLDDPYISPMKNYHDGRTYTSEYGFKLYEAGTATPAAGTEKVEYGGKPDAMREAARDYMATNGYERALAPTAFVWLNRFFWLNVVLLLLNLVPAYPLDGGQLMHALIWKYTDNYRQATMIACYSGYVVAMILLVISITNNSTLVLALGGFIFASSYFKLKQTIEGANEFGYDFSGGYSTLDAEDERPRRKPVSFFKRWLQARAAKRLKHEHDQRQREDERMDQLLEKIATQGRESLTAEERRFMQRVSERYRNP